MIYCREFEVNSIHFPGQKHRWKLSRLLQSGVQNANERLFKVCSSSSPEHQSISSSQELSWALYMLIIFARDRVFSNCFSFKATLRSWKQGFVSFIGQLNCLLLFIV